MRERESERERERERERDEERQRERNSAVIRNTTESTVKEEKCQRQVDTTDSCAMTYLVCFQHHHGGRYRLSGGEKVDNPRLIARQSCGSTTTHRSGC